MFTIKNLTLQYQADKKKGMRYFRVFNGNPGPIKLRKRFFNNEHKI